MVQFQFEVGPRGVFLVGGKVPYPSTPSASFNNISNIFYAICMRNHSIIIGNIIYIIIGNVVKRGQSREVGPRGGELMPLVSTVSPGPIWPSMLSIISEDYGLALQAKHTACVAIM